MNDKQLETLLKEKFAASNVTSIILRGELRKGQPCDFEITPQTLISLITERERVARVDEHEIVMRMWAKHGVGDIKFTNWSHYRRKSLRDLIALSQPRSNEK